MSAEFGDYAHHSSLDTESMQNNNSTIVTYSVLVGLSPLVPVPFVDDWLKNYFRRRMVRSLAASHGQMFSDETVSQIADETGGGGCVLGCLTMLVFYPLKKLFRKVFYFLEWKRAVDLTSHTYHFGYLLNFALREGYLKSDITDFESIRKAFDEVCANTSIKPIETVVSKTFQQTKGLIYSGAQILEKSFRNLKRKPTEEDVSIVVESVEEEEKEQLEGITSKLGNALSSIPDEHFKEMKEKFIQRMKASEPQSPAALESGQEAP